MVRYSCGVILVVWLLSCSMHAQAQHTVKAFPSAEGFGATAVGGRGGKVMFVTNLNDSGSGSFRDAMLKTFPRIVVFRVSGTIQLNSPIELSAAHSYVTVAGQTAPGDGIAIKGFPIQMVGFHDAIFRHLRVRPGTNGQPDNSYTDGLQILGGCYNLIFDHISLTWTGDEAGEIYTWGSGTRDITYQWSIFGEATTAFGEGAKGPFLAGPNSDTTNIDRVTYHHNYFVHLSDRSPGIWKGGTVQSINNVTYNNNGVGYSFNQVYKNVNHSIDIIGHYFKEGPSSSGYRSEAIRITWETCCGVTWTSRSPVSLYLSNNVAYKVNGTTYTSYFNPADQWSLVQINPGATYSKRTAPHSMQPLVPVTVQSAVAGKDLVLAHVGATKPRRDLVDTRLVNDFNGTGHIPGSGFSMTYPNLQTDNVPTDSDSDGIPDTWEISHGLNPNDASNGPAIAANGYTNLENYLNELAGDSVPGVVSTLTPPLNLQVISP